MTAVHHEECQLSSLLNINVHCRSQPNRSSRRIRHWLCLVAMSYNAVIRDYCGLNSAVSMQAVIMYDAFVRGLPNSYGAPTLHDIQAEFLAKSRWLC